MTVLTEGTLQITLPKGVVGRKFDDTSHRLSHCMRAVDFIIELKDRIYFIEVKDPDDPSAQRESSEAYINKLKSGEIDNDLKTKARDTFLYEYSTNRVKKPIYFFVLLGACSLSDAELIVRTDALKRQIPVSVPSQISWKRPFIQGCAVMNLASWNRTFGNMPVRRLAA